MKSDLFTFFMVRDWTANEDGEFDGEDNAVRWNHFLEYEPTHLTKGLENQIRLRSPAREIEEHWIPVIFLFLLENRAPREVSAEDRGFFIFRLSVFICKFLYLQREGETLPKGCSPQSLRMHFFYMKMRFCHKWFLDM